MPKQAGKKDNLSPADRGSFDSCGNHLWEALQIKRLSDHHTTCAHFLQYFIQELHSPVSVISYKATDSYSKYKNYPHFLQFACIAPLIADFDCFTPDNSKHLEMLCFETTYSVVDWPLESEVDQTLTDIPGRGG